MMRIAVIGGTGVYDPNMLTAVQEASLPTPYGTVSYQAGELEGRRVAFLPRHGSGHSIPPHQIHYRANIWAMKSLGVTHVIATTAVGSLRTDMRPGDFVLPDQFLDFTKNRTQTFYEGGERGVVHVDMTTPYCPRLRQLLAELARQQGTRVHTTGTYVCTEGPRFESPA